MRAGDITLGDARWAVKQVPGSLEERPAGQRPGPPLMGT